jgi:hypothetical protein
MEITMRDNFYGCIAGAHIGSAKGGGARQACFGWKSRKSNGFIDRFYETEHYHNGWNREPEQPRRIERQS